MAFVEELQGVVAEANVQGVTLARCRSVSPQFENSRIHFPTSIREELLNFLDANREIRPDRLAVYSPTTFMRWFTPPWTLAEVAAF